MAHTFVPAPEILDSPRGRRLAGAVPEALRVPAGPLPPTTPLAIIGGGLAALTLAAQMWHHGFHDYLILEHGSRLTGRFLERTAAVGQRVLRSPYEHHPGAEGHRDCEMVDFARLNWHKLTSVEKNEVRMAQSGQRAVAPLDVFEAYCSHVAAAHGVAEHTRQADVQEVRPAQGGHWDVKTDRGTVRSEAVVWAVGEQRRPAPAQWHTGSPRIRHWDEELPAELAGHERHAVVGAGLSAAHTVHDLCSRGLHVDWVFRGEEHYQCADVNAAFFRPEGRAMFGQERFEYRDERLKAERRPSIMFEFQPRLRAWEQQGLLTVRRHTAVVALADEGDTVRLGIDGGEDLLCDRAHLALGTETAFTPVLRGHAAATHKGLPLLDDKSLELVGAPGLFATGALASLALGPAARNIDGHRVAAARIAEALPLRIAANARPEPSHMPRRRM